MADACVANWRDDHGGTPGQSRQDRRGLVQRVLVVTAMRQQAGFDFAALIATDVTHLQQAVYEQTQARVGGQSSGAGMRRTQQPQLRQILHGVANRGGRKGQAASGQGARSHRLAGFQIAFDDAPEDFAGTGVHVDQRRSRCEQR